MTDMGNINSDTHGTIGDQFYIEHDDERGPREYKVRGVEHDRLICEVIAGNGTGTFVTLKASAVERLRNDEMRDPHFSVFPEYPPWQRGDGAPLDSDGNPNPWMTVTLDAHEVMVTRSQIDDRLLIEVTQYVDDDDSALRIVLNDGTIWDQGTDHAQLIWVGTVIRPESPQPMVYTARSEDALLEDMFKQNGVPEGLGFSETALHFEDRGLLVNWDSYYLLGDADTIPVDH